MSEAHREQHPLLYEDLSDEEQFSPRYQRRFRPMVFRGRVRNKVKGAAVIIRLWPEHWSTSVAYWWIGIGMIALTTFIVYNIVASVALLPPTPFKEMQMRTLNDAAIPIHDNSALPFNVYMHLFTENNQEIDLNSYLPYIDIIANKYTNIKFHLIIVLNDTSSDPNNLSAEENNENALNKLWAKNSVHWSLKTNVNIEHVTLSKYMEKSPLRQHWKQLPKQLLEFLTRAVSIWDKGGIAFNPTILTPRSPHAIYIEKLQNILKTFNHVSEKGTTKGFKTIKHHHLSAKKRVNNIRDIIDALENDQSDTIDLNPSNLEVKQKTIIDSERSHNSMHFNNKTNNERHHFHPKFTNITNHKNATDNIEVHDLQETLVMAESNKINHSIQQDFVKNSTVGILPMFLEFLFRNKADEIIPETASSNNNSTNLSRKRKHALPPNNKQNNTGFDIEKSFFNTEIKESKPVVISVKADHFDKDNVEINNDKIKNNYQLTIDLKGNIVSSAVSCHAFLGTMFGNAVHFDPKGSLTDFIIAELSIFCKGVLSSCNGIDVILL